MALTYKGSTQPSKECIVGAFSEEGGRGPPNAAHAGVNGYTQS